MDFAVQSLPPPAPTPIPSPIVPSRLSCDDRMHPTVSRACLQQRWGQGSAHCQGWLSWLSGTGTQQPGHGQGALYLPGPTLITPFLLVANKGLSLVHLIGMKMGQALGITGVSGVCGHPAGDGVMLPAACLPG